MTPADIKAAFANSYGLTVADLNDRDRSEPKAEARNAAMWVVRCVLGKSFPAIGKEFGCRDHSTVLFACRRIDRKVADSEAFRARLCQISTSLGLGPVFKPIACGDFAAAFMAGKRIDWTAAARKPEDRCVTCRRERREHVSGQPYAEQAAA